MAVCRTCGQENPEIARFCLACAAPLDGARLRRARTTRKTITVVFVDVVGSTALGERLDPESLRAVIGRYFEEMSAVVERHGGKVEKFIGDAVMAVFGIPVVREDDALRAVRAAVEMRDALTTLNAELEREHGVSIQVRIGVNTRRGRRRRPVGRAAVRDGRCGQRGRPARAGCPTRRDPRRREPPIASSGMRSRSRRSSRSPSRAKARPSRRRGSLAVAGRRGPPARIPDRRARRGARVPGSARSTASSPSRRAGW